MYFKKRAAPYPKQKKAALVPETNHLSQGSFILYHRND